MTGRVEGGRKEKGKGSWTNPSSGFEKTSLGITARQRGTQKLPLQGLYQHISQWYQLGCRCFVAGSL